MDKSSLGRLQPIDVFNTLFLALQGMGTCRVCKGQKVPWGLNIEMDLLCV